MGIPAPSAQGEPHYQQHVEHEWNMEKSSRSPVRVAIVTYIEEYAAKSNQGIQIDGGRLKEMLIDVAQVATEQELDRCLAQLREHRPILTRTNNWNEILKR